MSVRKQVDGASHALRSELLPVRLRRPVILDGRKMPPDARLDVDSCIIFARPARLSLARELAHSAVRVAVLESGGLDRKPDIDRLGAGDSVGYPHNALDRVRAWRIGGPSRHWACMKTGMRKAGPRALWSRLTSSRPRACLCPAGHSAIVPWSRTTCVRRWSPVSDHSPTTRHAGSERAPDAYSRVIA
jgi:hypothetical protein